MIPILRLGTALSEASVREQIVADARCILQLLGTVDKLVGGSSGATESIQENADHIIECAQKIDAVPVTQQAETAEQAKPVAALTDKGRAVIWNDNYYQEPWVSKYRPLYLAPTTSTAPATQQVGAAVASTEEENEIAYANSGYKHFMDFHTFKAFRADCAKSAATTASASDAEEAAKLQTLLITEFECYRTAQGGLYAWALNALLDNSPHRMCTALSQDAAQPIKTWQERYDEMGVGPSFSDKYVAMMAEIAELRAALAEQK